ncbi:unnamed protein product [Didymodactylos carnosus]|uniref:asparagine--tRNA ligase n=1 Tax=Didymodactylos carnosus TaxID=1234261 RepID=A0A813ZRJ4_9BILA|nr:unnamed protein product [Didymodactylos carnosus]CAF0902308.1 unnamed protein product [Didymodactylos carnosus]CAF3598772.1 unnamed protein product [Didymodactylos carnosus]CAF3684600.1 unnamed protein product [Didymodactylos carnosus]
MFSLIYRFYFHLPASRIHYYLTRSITTSIYPQTVSDILKTKPIGSSVSLIGSLENVRKLKTQYFLDFIDGSSLNHLQVIVSGKNLPDVGKLNFGSTIRVNGTIVRSTHPQQEIELQAKQIDIIGSCDAFNYPLKCKTKHSFHFLRSCEQFRARDRMYGGALLSIRSELFYLIHNYFHEHKFTHIQTPCITSSDCEGGGETFKIKEYYSQSTSQMKEYFDKQTYLTVSGQLHLEAAASGLSRVYTLNPVFRADKNLSRFHLAEFWMLEAEIAGITKLEQLLDIYKHILQTVTANLRQNCREQFRLLEEYDIKPEFIDQFFLDKYSIVTYDEAVGYLKKSDEFQDFPKNGDFTRAHENYLCQKIMNNQPFFLINYPKEVKPFYMLVNDDECTVANFDFIFPSVGELSGGSLREHRYERLHKTVELLKLDDELDWYLDLRRYGSMPTAGFGLGIERFLIALTGIDNVRDVIPFPRYYQHCMS